MTHARPRPCVPKGDETLQTAMNVFVMACRSCQLGSGFNAKVAGLLFVSHVYCCLEMCCTYPRFLSSKPTQFSFFSIWNDFHSINHGVTQYIFRIWPAKWWWKVSLKRNKTGKQGKWGKGFDVRFNRQSDSDKKKKQMLPVLPEIKCFKPLKWLSMRRPE